MSAEPVTGSIVKIEQVKAYLRITHSDDDVLLQDLIEQAEDECCQFLNRRSLPRRKQTGEDPLDSNTLPEWDSNLLDSNHHFPYREAVSDSDELATPVRGGIYLIVQGMYEGKDADEMQKIRTAAEVKWQPYRTKIGV
jgi:hypothetical protein